MNDTTLTTVYVALGSNLGDRELHLIKACSDMQMLSGAFDLQCSSVYETDPMGPQNQPDYLNAVCRFEYAHKHRQLLQELQFIERGHGRIESRKRWTARPLDLDILLFGNQIIDEPDLQIPHVGICDRSFVLWPLYELEPELDVPGRGPVEEMRQSCQQFGIKGYKQAAK